MAVVCSYGGTLARASVTQQSVSSSTAACVGSNGVSTIVNTTISVEATFIDVWKKMEVSKTRIDKFVHYSYLDKSVHWRPACIQSYICIHRIQWY